MTASTPSRPAGRRRRRRPTRAQIRRRRFVGFLILLVLAGSAFALTRLSLDDAVLELTLPLRHDDVIRQQADAKDLDPALIAAVIYQESKFRDQTSPAGAKGLMQITPDTARFIARKSGGTAFELRDLGTPQINIAYGSWYLRHLLDRFDQNVPAATAAYNAGAEHAARWVREAGGLDEFDHRTDIPFPETREYVKGVLEKQREYRANYADELGL